MRHRSLALALFLAGPSAAAAQAGAHPFRLPEPTGPYPVGTTGFSVRRAGGGGVPDAPDELVVTVWYPAGDVAGSPSAPYLPEEGALRVMAAYGRNPAGTALLARDVATHSRLGAPVADIGNPLPILLFSHGYLGLPSDYTALMEDLASHGFAVFSVAHTGEAMAVTLSGGEARTLFGPDNRLGSQAADVIGEWDDEDAVSAEVTGATTPEHAEQALRGYLARTPKSARVVERWAADMRIVVDEIERTAAGGSGSPFSGRLDLDRLGALGHSMGGVSSAAFCARDARCRAAANLDGSPQYGDLIDRPSPRPFLMVYGSRPGRVGVSDPIYARGASYCRAVIEGALHLNFGDWQFWEGPGRLDAALGPIPAGRSAEIVHRLVREFFAQELGIARSPLLSGEDAYPELGVRWLAGPGAERPGGLP